MNGNQLVLEDARACVLILSQRILSLKGSRCDAERRNISEELVSIATVLLKRFSDEPKSLESAGKPNDEQGNDYFEPAPGFLTNQGIRRPRVE